MSCEDQALMPTEVCLKWGCDKAKLELMNTFWTCPVCKSSYGAEAKIGLLSYEYVNRFGTEVEVCVEADSSGQYEMTDVLLDGDLVDTDAGGADCMLIGDLVVDIIDKDEEIAALKERNEELQGQYDSMFRTMVTAGEKLAALEQANAWLRSLRKQDMP